MIRQNAKVGATGGRAQQSGDLTLSRLNRAHPKKHDVFVLDFLNDADPIRDAFADFYRATILAGETDPDKLHDLQADLDAAQVHSPEQIDDLVQHHLGGADRDELDPILDDCAAVYVHEVDEDAQVDFKGKAFVRTSGFLSCVPPYTNAEWEKRSIFLNFLIPTPSASSLSIRSLRRDLPYNLPRGCSRQTSGSVASRRLG